MKTVFTFYKNSQKGQDLVEYALMLAIIIGIGWGIYSQTGVADSIKNVFGNASSLMETAKKNTGTIDMKALIDRIEAIQTDYRSGPYGMGYTRGLIQSSWLTGDDKHDSTIGKLASELDATMWTYYNGKKSDLENGVLYWTTEELDSVTLTPNAKTSGNNWSKETVLSYRYDRDTGTYSVIKNHVWLDQPGADGNTHKGLAQLSGEYNKPAGEKIGPSYHTYAEAQQAYEQAKKANNNSVVFTNK